MQIEAHKKIGQEKIRIDLDQFKLQVSFKPGSFISLHFDTPSRRFYLALIAMTVYQMKKARRVAAIAEHELAVASAKNPQEFYHYAGTLLAAGQPERCARIYEQIMRRDPRPPAYHHRLLGCAYFNAGNYEKALTQFQRLHDDFKAGKYRPSGPVFGGASHLHLAGTYVMLGNYKKANDHIKGLLDTNPEFSFEEWEKNMALSYRHKADVDRWVLALRRAGLQ